MSNAIFSAGTKLEKLVELTYTSIGEINSIGGISLAADEIEVTHLNSTGGYREYIQGFKDSGEMTVELNYVKSDLTTLKADYDNGGVNTYKITFPDNSTIDFTAWVKGLTIGAAQVGEALKISLTLRVTGEITFTEAT